MKKTLYFTCWLFLAIFLSKSWLKRKNWRNFYEKCTIYILRSFPPFLSSKPMEQRMTEIKWTIYWRFSVISTLYKKTRNLENNVDSVNMISGNKHLHDFSNLYGFFIKNTFCYVSKRNTKMNYCQAIYFFSSWFV